MNGTTAYPFFRNIDLTHGAVSRGFRSDPELLRPRSGLSRKELLTSLPLLSVELLRTSSLPTSFWEGIEYILVRIRLLLVEQSTCNSVFIPGPCFLSGKDL